MDSPIIQREARALLQRPLGKGPSSNAFEAKKRMLLQALAAQRRHAQVCLYACVFSVRGDTRFVLVCECTCLVVKITRGMFQVAFLMPSSCVRRGMHTIWFQICFAS